jgi:hypothetical protein
MELVGENNYFLVKAPWSSNVSGALTFLGNLCIPTTYIDVKGGGVLFLDTSKEAIAAGRHDTIYEYFANRRFW